MRIAETSRNRARRGQSLIESALVTMVFLVLLIGVLDVGQVLFVHQTLVERTRAALRYGSVRSFDGDAIRNMVLYNSPAAPTPSEPDDDDEAEVIPGIFGLSPSMVQVRREDATFAEDRIVIEITNYPFRFYTPFIAGLRHGRVISGSMPYEWVS